MNSRIYVLFNIYFWYFIIFWHLVLFLNWVNFSTSELQRASAFTSCPTKLRQPLPFFSSLPAFLSYQTPTSNLTGQYSKPSQVSNFTTIQTILRSKSKMPTGTSVHVTALDGIVNVNSLFTLAVFVGLTWNPNDPSNTLINDPACAAGPSKAKDLVSFHVYSFSSFLFSSLIFVGSFILKGN